MKKSLLASLLLAMLACAQVVVTMEDDNLDETGSSMIDEMEDDNSDESDELSDDAQGITIKINDENGNGGEEEEDVSISDISE